MPWSTHVFYNSDPTLSLELKLKVLGESALAGQAVVLCDSTTMFSLRQKEGAIHTEELVYELNPLGEWPSTSSHRFPKWVQGVGDVDSRTGCQLPPFPQTTEAGPWKFLATLIPM